MISMRLQSIAGTPEGFTDLRNAMIEMPESKGAYVLVLSVKETQRCCVYAQIQQSCSDFRQPMWSSPLYDPSHETALSRIAYDTNARYYKSNIGVERNGSRSCL